MTKPQIWCLDENQQNYRVAFNFINESGKLLRTKTVQFQKTSTEPAKLILLQAVVKPAPATKQPVMRILARNFIEVTTVISAIEGDLISKAFVGFLGGEKVNELLAEYPLTLCLIVENSGIHFTIHIQE
jgi:hypothetical protein